MQKEYKHKYLKTNIKVNFLKKIYQNLATTWHSLAPATVAISEQASSEYFFKKVWLISKKFSHFEKMLLFFTVASYRGGNVRNLI